MNTPIQGTVPKIRLNTHLRQLAGKAQSAADLLWLAAVTPHADAVSVERFEVIIDLLCDVAVELGGIVEGLREEGAI